MAPVRPQQARNTIATRMDADTEFETVLYRQADFIERSKKAPPLPPYPTIPAFPIADPRSR
jgi:hypothetical protein